MKKKIRHIIIDDIHYTWCVVPVDDDGINLIRIYSNKKIVHTESVDMYDKNGNMIEITPLTIANIIGDNNLYW